MAAHGGDLKTKSYLSCTKLILTYGGGGTRNMNTRGGKFDISGPEYFQN